jgi:hypothetical protein
MNTNKLLKTMFAVSGVLLIVAFILNFSSLQSVPSPLYGTYSFEIIKGTFTYNFGVNPTELILINFPAIIYLLIALVYAGMLALIFKKEDVASFLKTFMIYSIVIALGLLVFNLRQLSLIPETINGEILNGFSTYSFSVRTGIVTEITRLDNFVVLFFMVVSFAAVFIPTKSLEGEE